MIKRLISFCTAVFMLLNAWGCIPLLFGAAGGAGTSVWLSGKLTQEFNQPYDRTITAAENALKSLDLEITKKTRAETVTQFRSKYTDGKEIWIDVRKITEKSTKVEVRVGAISPDKAASDKILKRIQKYL
jgi:hypothetical protein